MSMLPLFDLFRKLTERRFKKSGEFDRLRRELLTQFKHGVSSYYHLHPKNNFSTTLSSKDGIPAFKSRIEDIARQVRSDQGSPALGHS